MGGVADHVHGLCELGEAISVDELLKELKRESSLWIKTKSSSLADFAWQSGDAVFSVGAEDVEAIRDYIIHQEDYHRTISFEDEFRKLLTINEVEWDEQFVWD